MKLTLRFLIGVIFVGLLVAGLLFSVLTGAQSESCTVGLSPNTSSLQEQEQEIQEEQPEDSNTARVVVRCRPGGAEAAP